MYPHLQNSSSKAVNVQTSIPNQIVPIYICVYVYENPAVKLNPGNIRTHTHDTTHCYKWRTVKMRRISSKYN